MIERAVVGRQPGRSTVLVARCAVIVLGLLLLSVGCASLGRPSGGSATAPGPSAVATETRADRSIPRASYIFVIVMENKEYGDIVGSPDAPYVNQLARTYGLAANYYAVRHPSLPNYLALISGSTQGIVDDCADCSVDATNLVDQLEEHHLTWKAYQEDLPGPCFNGTQAGASTPLIQTGGYVRRHDPFMYFANIREKPGRCQNVVPLRQFDMDLQQGRLPNYVWITPNLQHDMHDGSVQEGDRWLASFVPRILQSSTWKDSGMLFIVWDEGQTDAGCCGNAAGGRVPAVVVAAQGKRGYLSQTPYSHYSLLRTIEDAWDLGHLGHAADPGTTPMVDFFH